MPASRNLRDIHSTPTMSEDTAKTPEVEDVILSDDEEETKNLKTDSNPAPPPPPKDTDENHENPYDEEALQDAAPESTTSTRTQDPIHSPPPPPPKARIAGQKFVLSETNTEVYVTQSPTPTNAAKLVILLTNSLGLASENNLALADTYSRKLGVPVIVPDMFEGDPIPTHGATIAEEPVTDDSASSLLNVFKLRAAGAVKGFLDEMWMAKHTFERVAPRLTATVAEIAQVYKPTSIAVVGYSFGGKYVLHLLQGDRGSDEWSSDEDLITCGASIAPSLLVGDDFKQVAKPLFLVAPDRDEMLPEELLNKGVSKLQQRGVTFERTTFGEGQPEPLPHGFAVPGDYDSEVVGDTPDRVIDIVSTWVKNQF